MWWLIGIAVLLLISCKDSDTNSNDKPNNDSNTEIASDSLIAINQKRLYDLGDLTLIRVDKEQKCNLTEGYYFLNKLVTDSSDLAFLAKHYASELFQKTKKDIACSYPVMSSSFIYLSHAEYKKDQSNYIVMCNVTPNNYSGEVFVNKYALRSMNK